MSETTTIAALATAPAPAGIAVVRVSGPRTKQALRAIFRAKKTDPVSDPRRLTYGELIDYQTGAVIDHALAVYMPGPNSYTGEDVGEFQFHGSPALVQKVLRSLLAFGATAAEPGEFTRRAFLNGKIDLVQAEAIGELIQATSEQALRVASEHLHGRFSEAVNGIGEPLREGLAELEARIDFPDEEVPRELGERVERAVSGAHGRVLGLLRTYSYGQHLREGFRVLLCGRPNVGKSSIMNRLLGRKRVIVSEHSGTTRDLIEEEASIGGHRFIFCDSAGLRESDDEVERLGVELAKERIEWADLVMFVVDAAAAGREWEQVLEYLRGRAKKIWMVVNKIDLNPGAVGTVFCDSYTCAQNFYLSAKSGDGFEALLQALSEEVASSVPHTGESSNVVTNERHRNCLARAADALARAERGLRERAPLELVSADVRGALAALDEIVGKTHNEEILGRIFSKFCIGK